MPLELFLALNDLPFITIAMAIIKTMKLIINDDVKSACTRFPLKLIGSILMIYLACRLIDTLINLVLHINHMKN